MDSPAVSAGLAEDCFVHPISSQGIHPFDALSKKSLMLILFFFISSAVFWISHYRQILTPKRVLAVFIIAWIILFINNILKTPVVIVGFDCAGHLDYIQYILDHKSFPLANVGWETHQPPLFYLASAIVKSISRPLLNPDNSMYSLKLVPFLCGIGQICLAWFAACLIFPDSKTKQSLSIAIAAVIPMNIYTSGFLSNESSSAFLMGLAILVTIIILNKSKSRGSWWLYLILGLVIGLALMAKITVLAILPVIFLVILYKLFYEEKCPVTKMGGNIGLMLLAATVIAGWFFARNWIHFHKFIMTAWEYSILPPWWQDPGFHTYKYFCQFGKVFTQPYYAGTYSLFDSLYATFWGDANFSGAVSYAHRPPWNYEYMSAVYLLAIPVALIILIGTVLAIGKLIRTADKIWLLILGSLFTITYSIVYMALRIPCYSQAKASYGLGAALQISLLFAFGFDALNRWLKDKRYASVHSPESRTLNLSRWKPNIRRFVQSVSQ